MIGKFNFLNIRYNPANQWQGMTGNERGFVKFSAPEFGWRAALKLLFNYHRLGFNTITKIVTRWAPPSENDTAKYIKFVAKRTELDKDAVITSRVDLCKVCAAMAMMETSTYVSHLVLYDYVLKYRMVIQTD